MRATLGGKPLLDAEIVWTLKDGVQPVIHSFEMAPLDAVAVYTTGGPISLEITPDQGNPVKVDNLWVLNIMPGPDAYVSSVTVADRRWMWSYSALRFDFNHRRNVGTKRLVANDQVPQVNPIASKIAYWNWSLNNGQPFTPLAMLQKVLKKLSDDERRYYGNGFDVVIDDRIGSNLKSLPIEDLTIADQGDQGLQRALSYLPEAFVYVDYDGKVIVTSRATGDERAVIQALLPELQDEGHTDLVYNRLIRPKEIHVLFTREVELRFNFVENATAIGATITSDPPDSRTLENVLPTPDYQLTTADGVSAARAPICMGTWITFDEAFNYWGNMPVVTRNGSRRKLDHDFIQRAFIPEMDLWACFQIAGERPDERGELKDWMGRITACQNHYRMTFRIVSPFMDRIRSIRAYRATTADPVSRTRSPALAFGDYCIMYTQRSIWKNIAQGAKLDYAINKSGYPTSGNLDSTAVPSPCEVEVVDSDQGIIRLNYKPNPIYGMNETILPSQMQTDSMPTADITQTTRPITFDSVIEGQRPPRLSPSYKCAVILTAVPASPNSSQQLHKVIVKPNDVANMVPDSQAAGLSDAQGPIMEVLVGAQVEVARIAWKDDRATDIERIFGLTEGEPNLQDLVINEGATGDLANGASLNAIAKATAARIYASLGDRFEGSMAGYMNGQVKPAGWLSEVRHHVSPTGETTTVLEMPTQVPQLSLFSYLDSATRQAILGLVQPQ